MPTIITHAVTGGLCANSIESTGKIKLTILAMICSMLPDADVIAFFFNIKYGDTFGHRGFSHSFVFAITVGFLIFMIFYRDRKFFSKSGFFLFLFFTLITASHGILDAITNGGLGVAFFSPFSNHRYFLPWTPVEVSPIGVKRFLSSRGVQVLLSEIKWIWTPFILNFFVMLFYRRWFKRS